MNTDNIDVTADHGSGIPRLVARTTSPTGVATDDSLREVVAWLGCGATADYIRERIGTEDATLLGQATCAARDAILCGLGVL